MAQLMITGHQARRGAIQVSGAKNASLPLMAACLLTNENVTLKNVPNISDITNMKKHLESYGVQVSGSGTEIVLNASNPKPQPNPSDNRRDIRGAVLVLGPMLARRGEAQVFHPGGCQIDKKGRPIDYHIDALKMMGAQEVSTNGNSIQLTAPRGLRGAEIKFPQVSVGATENIVMAACLADGRTTIENAAVEPEVIDLVDMLKKMGASIDVYPGDNMIVIDGRRQLLSGVTHTVIPDRIEAGSYAIAAAIVGGPLLLKMDTEKGKKMLEQIVRKLSYAGVTVTWKPNGLEVQRQRHDPIKPVDIETGPYPGFPTDLLPQWVTLMTQANGNSRMNDTIFDNRYEHVPELEKMGGSFKRMSDSVLKVSGQRRLRGGAHVKAKDLRGGMALVLAALAAEGPTVVKEIEHVLRGYANLEGNLKECGAKFDSGSGVLPPTRPGHYGNR